MKIDEAITRYKSNADYERTHGNLQGYLEFKQLVEWLEKLQKIKELSYRGVPTFRNYEDYHDAEQYTKGWNDAMDYIFSESKKAREREAARKKLKLLEAESDIEVRKPCINYEDGCEEWAGCPCVHFKARK